MADYFTHISFAFEVTPEQAEQLDNAFGFDSQEISEDTPWPDNLQPIWSTKEDFYRGITGEPSDDYLVLGLGEYGLQENGSYWIQSDGPVLNHIVAIIQSICKPEKPISFEWSNTCSKPRLDGYGGGFCVIGKDRVYFENTHQRLSAALETFENMVDA